MNHIEKSKELGLNAEQYVLVGGSVLDIHGIRTSDDIDVIVSTEAFEELRNREGWKLDDEFQKKWGKERLLCGVFEVLQGLHFDYCDYLFTFKMLKSISHKIDGVYVQSPALLLLGKKDIGREKDLNDIELIEEYFKAQ